MVAEYVQVQVAIDSREKAGELARSIVESRLAACVQILGPVVSTYWWRGVMETADEYLLLAKTTGAAVEELTGHIRARHPYDVPEIVAVPIEHGLGDYLNWISTETSRRSSS